MKHLAQAAGVNPEKVFPHNLRHLFAVGFYKMTHDLTQLADLLGHSSLEVTRIYTRICAEDCRKAIDRFYDRIQKVQNINYVVNPKNLLKSM